MKEVMVLLALVMAAVSAAPQSEPKFGTSEFRKYQVAVKSNRNARSHWCGGTIIDKRWILAGAHCSKDSNSLDLYMPNNKRGDPIHIHKENIFIHPGYKSDTFENDISLIKLPADIEFNEHVEKVDLPKKGDTDTYVDKLAITSGWGSCKGDNYVLHNNEVAILSNTDCNSLFSEVANESQICIKVPPNTGTAKVPCRQGSSGPLVLSGTKTVIGITSFIMLSCGDERKQSLDIFARTSSHLDWIKEVSGVTNN